MCSIGKYLTVDIMRYGSWGCGTLLVDVLGDTVSHGDRLMEFSYDL